MRRLHPTLADHAEARLHLPLFRRRLRELLLDSLRRHRSGSDSMAMPASTRSSCRSLKMFLVGAVGTRVARGELFRQIAKQARYEDLRHPRPHAERQRIGRRSAQAACGIRETEHVADDAFGVVETSARAAAAEPSMSMCPDGGMLARLSVHRRAGIMYRKYKELFGNDDSEDIYWFHRPLLWTPHCLRTCSKCVEGERSAGESGVFERLAR